MTGIPSEEQKRYLTRGIPDDCGTVTFDVERVVVTWSDGSESVMPVAVLDWKPNGSVRHERRTITVSATEWTVTE